MESAKGALFKRPTKRQLSCFATRFQRRSNRARGRLAGLSTRVDRPNSQRSNERRKRSCSDACDDAPWSRLVECNDGIRRAWLYADHLIKPPVSLPDDHEPQAIAIRRSEKPIAE